MTLHDFIILMILLIETSGYNEIQYKIYKWIHSEVTNISTRNVVIFDVYVSFLLIHEIMAHFTSFQRRVYKEYFDMCETT